MAKDTFFFVLFGLMGLSAFVGFLRDLWLAIRSHHWNLVDCNIIESRVEGKKGWRVYSYVPIISYEYTLDGVHYEGHNLKYGDTWGFASEANDYCEKYSEGKVVKLSFDPLNHKRSVLEPGVPVVLIAKIIFSAVIGTWGFAALILDSPTHH